jgi:hypothetical protein
MYAGCAWLAVAAVLVVGAYWGLGLAGPSALPVVALYLGVAAAFVALAAALWSGFGGRPVALVSLIMGVVLAVIPLTKWWGSDETGLDSRVGAALFGVAVVLTSAFALRRGREEATRQR